MIVLLAEQEMTIVHSAERMDHIVPPNQIIPKTYVAIKIHNFPQIE